MKMNFHLNDIAFNLNWVEFKYVEFNSNFIKIHLKRNGMQIGEESIENLLMNMVLEKKTLKYIDPKKTVSMPFFIGN